MKLKDIPPPSIFYKDPEELADPKDPDREALLRGLREIAGRYRLVRSKLSVEKKDVKAK